MDYKGFDITAVVRVKERQDVDENGNTTEFRDSWCVGDCVYEAQRDGLIITRSTFEEIKAEVDRWINFQGVQITLGERNDK